MAIAPKMAEQYAEKARRGEAHNYIGSNIAEFYIGNQAITLVSFRRPGSAQGHVSKVSTSEMTRLKEQASNLKD